LEGLTTPKPQKRTRSPLVPIRLMLPSSFQHSLVRPLWLSAVAGAVLAASSVLGTFAASGEVEHPSERGWSLVFEDLFDGTEIDGSRWTGCYWWDRGGCTNLGNNELQWYRRGNTTLQDGGLVIEAREEKVDTSEGTFHYTSGLISTGRTDAEGLREDRFSFTYGYVEVRARVPKGAGLWPAIWLLPSDHDSRPEIDIMEVLGQATDVLEMHYHYEVEGAEESLGHDRRVADLSEDWHEYALDWSADAIVWYLDGTEQWRVDDRAIISDEPMYLLINLAVGGEWPGSPSADTEFPARFEIDHVKIWQPTQ
jgi:beta-glucanase (GH16 family)